MKVPTFQAALILLVIAALLLMAASTHRAGHYKTAPTPTPTPVTGMSLRPRSGNPQQFQRLGATAAKNESIAVHDSGKLSHSTVRAEHQQTDVKPAQAASASDKGKDIYASATAGWLGNPPGRRASTVKSVVMTIQVDSATAGWVGKDVESLKPDSEDPCGYSCSVNFSNPQRVGNADIVVFQGVSLPGRPPRRAHPEQLWAFVAGEPQIFHRNSGGFHQWDGLFNYSVTYLSTSEANVQGFLFSYPVVKREKPLSRNFAQERRDLAKHKLAGNKTASALWFVSNCFTESEYAVMSDRMDYALQLAEYIKVDAFTHKSGHKTCKDELKHLAKFEEDGLKPQFNDYWFYLSFENSYCKDYITEKFWKILSADTLAIPIAMGGTDIEEYTRIAPPNSFIHVDNFTSPKHLAEHLNYVVNNDNAYNYYLEWRNHYRIKTARHENWLCYMCQLAHDRPERVWRNFSQDFTPRDCKRKASWSASSVQATSMRLIAFSLNLLLVLNIGS